MRAKFSCWRVVDQNDKDGNKYQENAEFGAVTGDGSDENKTFWNATPAAHLSMSITNPKAFGSFKPGAEYYVDFTEAVK